MLARVPTPQAFNSDAGLGQLMDVVHNGGLDGLFGTPVGEEHRRRSGAPAQS